MKSLIEMKQCRCIKKELVCIYQFKEKIYGHYETSSIFYTKNIHYCAIFTRVKFVIPNVVRYKLEI